MYNFGDNKQTADLMMRSAAAQIGPGISQEEDLEKCTKTEIQSRLIYASVSLRKAARNGESEELLEECCKLYEKYLIAFCWRSDAILMAIETNNHSYPWNNYGAKMRQKILVERTCEARRERDRNDKKNQQQG